LADLVEKPKHAISQFCTSIFSELLPSVGEKVEIGTPARNSVQEMEKEGSDLIVMSTHGRTGLRMP
jgi:nucleotide-binding universal stress UspA family protein